MDAWNIVGFTEPNNFRAIGRSRSRSPRRRRPESRDRSHRRGAEKYRYIGGEQLSREAHGDPEHREKTRWDVGDPERGREQVSNEVDNYITYLA